MCGHHGNLALKRSPDTDVGDRLADAMTVEEETLRQQKQKFELIDGDGEVEEKPEVAEEISSVQEVLLSEVLGTLGEISEESARTVRAGLIERRAAKARAITTLGRVLNLSIPLKQSGVLRQREKVLAEVRNVLSSDFEPNFIEGMIPPLLKSENGDEQAKSSSEEFEETSPEVTPEDMSRLESQKEEILEILSETYRSMVALPKGRGKSKQRARRLLRRDAIERLAKVFDYQLPRKESGIIRECSNVLRLVRDVLSKFMEPKAVEGVIPDLVKGRRY
ncbi:hypothetical protein ACFL21_01635 [Patescibacteria group bacterium]